MLVDGKQIAKEVVEALKTKRASMARPPTLGIVVGVDDPVTSAYVSLKLKTAAELGVEVRKETFSPNATTDDVVQMVTKLAEGVDALVVQLPLPAAVDASRVLAAVPPEKDVDALNPSVDNAHRKVFAPVAEAVREILTHYKVSLEGTKAVVIGQGQLVGQPSAALLKQLGAEVEVVTKDTGSLEALLQADIVVSGAGTPGIIQPHMLKPGVLLIDAGTSEQSGRVVGDADPACADVASLFTPVPGGVGPLSIAMLFKNLFTLLSDK